MDELEPYKTSDFPLAAFLYMKGLAIVTVTPDPNNDSRKIFVFLDIDKRPLLEVEFADNKGQFKDYYYAIKSVRSHLYGDKE